MSKSINEKKNVVLALPMLLTGGTEVQTLYTAIALIRLGYKVRVCCYFEYEKRMVERYRNRGVHVDLLNLSRKESVNCLVKRLIDYTKDNQVDIAHVQYVQPGFLPILAFRLAGVKRVFTTIHQMGDGQSIKARTLHKAASMLATESICVSASVAHSWFGVFDRLYSKHRVIYNCVENSWIREGAEKPKNIEFPSGLSMCIIGRLRNEKGQDIAIRAVKHLASEGKVVTLYLVGDGPDKTEYVELCEKLDVQDRVFFKGSCEPGYIVDFLDSVDVVVIPSRSEGFGLVAVEAMARGLPVVAAKVGGLVEIIEDGVDGLLFQPESAEHLASTISKLEGNEALRRQIGGRAHEKVKERYSFSAYVNNLGAVYDES